MHSHERLNLRFTTTILTIYPTTCWFSYGNSFHDKSNIIIKFCSVLKKSTPCRNFEDVKWQLASTTVYLENIYQCFIKLSAGSAWLVESLHSHYAHALTPKWRKRKRKHGPMQGCAATALTNERLFEKGVLRKNVRRGLSTGISLPACSLSPLSIC
jgi:hypothetical protein